MTMTAFSASSSASSSEGTPSRAASSVLAGGKNGFINLLVCIILPGLLLASPALAQDTATTQPQNAPATQPAAAGIGKFPGIEIDVKKKQIRVECEALNVQMPLEFFCVQNGGPEHETVLRTAAKPSGIHFGLLSMGLTPGEPAHYISDTDTWYAPSGPPLKISCEFLKGDKLQTVPANRMMRSVKDHKEMPAMTWVFDGSRVMPDGQYAADITSYVVSIVNFDLTMIDVPELASNSNDTLEWEFNPDVCPKKGTKVTMIIEPTGGPAIKPAGKHLGKFNPGPGLGGGGAPTTVPGDK
jgi:hypothetical protein